MVQEFCLINSYSYTTQHVKYFSECHPMHSLQLKTVSPFAQHAIMASSRNLQQLQQCERNNYAERPNHWLIQDRHVLYMQNLALSYANLMLRWNQLQELSDSGMVLRYI